MERVGTAQEGHQTGLLIHVELVLNQLRSTIGLHYIITARNHAQHLLMLHALAVYVYIKFCRCWRFFRQEYIKITSKFVVFQANLRQKVTHSVQTELSHYKRDNDTQVYLPR